ncbi:MAG: aldo/keto reductase [Polyangiaceae bacterium]|nr:aldo/keto reductase [Polyangiaceae bacterium]
MEYTKLGSSGLHVSRIGLGTWAMGGLLWGGTDENDAVRAIVAAVDHGITLVDTAPIYGFGTSERIVGSALKQLGHRDRLVIATKLGLAWDERGRVRRDASAAGMTRELHESLRRLGTEYVDVYQVHWPDATVPAEETASALARLLEQGKIRAIGVSNYSPEQMDAFRAAAPLHVCQPPYNLFERGIEADVLPYCREHRIGTLMYGALCRGLLSGRMRAGTTFARDDIRKVDPKFRSPRFEQYLQAVAHLGVVAAESGHTVLQLAVRWVLDQPGSEVALWGARNAGQLDTVSGVMGWTLDNATRARIDAIVHGAIASPVGPEFMAPPA